MGERDGWRREEIESRSKTLKVIYQDKSFASLLMKEENRENATRSLRIDGIPLTKRS